MNTNELLVVLITLTCAGGFLAVWMRRDDDFAHLDRVPDVHS